MRFDTKVEFCRMVPGSYNYNTGNYEGDSETSVSLFASVTDSQAEMVRMVYGSLAKKSLTIRIQGKAGNFDYIRIGKDKYQVDYRRTLRNLETFVVSGV